MRLDILSKTMIYLGILAAAGPLSSLEPLGSSFSYQGLLEDGGSPANGQYDFLFALYDGPDPLTATQLGTATRIDVSVMEGLFVVDLDFGLSVFDGESRWLEIRVRPAGSSSLETLTPLQPIRPTPYALFALSGNEGPQGPQGEQGDQGEQGPQGPPGELTGPAGGDLEGSYPNPDIKESAAVLELEGLTGAINLFGGRGIFVDTTGQVIVIENTGLPDLRSWHFNIFNLSDVQLGSGGIDYISSSDLDVPIPVYLFRETGSGNTITSGVTTLPLNGEIGASDLIATLFWVTSQDGGEVRWRMTYSARNAGGRLNNDDELMQTTPVDNTGEDRVYATSFTLASGFSGSDDVLAFTLTRQAPLDSNTGDVGLLGIRFSYEPYE